MKCWENKAPGTLKRSVYMYFQQCLHDDDGYITLRVCLVFFLFSRVNIITLNEALNHFKHKRARKQSVSGQIFHRGVYLFSVHQ